MNRLQLAINVAIEAHRDQYDRGGTLYINHPMYLSLQMDTEEEKIVALLHDVIEDSDKFTLGELRYWFGDVIADAVDCITKRKNIKEKYEDYLARVKLNSLALKVKLADISHNLCLDRIPEPDEKYMRMKNKYMEALKYLNS